jgi:hypothetical protein
MRKVVKSRGIAIVIFLAVILIVPLISAGFFQNVWNKITGMGSSTQNVLVNISVTSGVQTIYSIYNASSAITLTDAPSPTFVIINFSVLEPDGVATLNNATAAVNLTKAGQELRQNSTCAVKDWSGNYANYTCNVTMWWWDNPGLWTVYANISDLAANTVVNSANTVTVNSLTGFVMSPSALTFSSMNAGATNQTPTNNLLLNNTGNTNTTGIQINATDLVGETIKSQFLWASNFSASNSTGGNIECNITANATQMVNMTFTASIGNVNITAGNYTKNDGTAQERMYMCLRKVGYELTQQQYSTNQFGSWTVKTVYS